MVMAHAIKKGYKQTEIGVLPEDWGTLLFGEIASLRKEKYDSRKDGNNEFCVELEHIGQGTGALVGHSEATQNSSIKNVFHKDDVLFGRLRSYLRKYWKADRNGVASTEIWPLVANPKHTSPSYLFQIVQTKRFIDASGEAYGTHMPRTDWNVIKSLQTPLPQSKSEQEAIAAVLSNIDELIERLGKIIVKKNALKQGAMQQLLTGKKRLPGYSGEWNPLELGVVGACFAGGTPSTFNSNYWNGPHIWLPSGRIQNNILQKLEDEITITQLGLEESAAKLIKPQSVLVAITGATCGNIGLLNFAASANQSVIAIEPNALTDYRFLYYSLLLKRREILSNQTGSAQGGVNLKAIKGIKVLFPSLEEQGAVSAILYDMDVEIDTLAQKRDKYVMLKQGMMQQLLTGKIRIYANN